jgi:hypothetical protein
MIESFNMKSEEKCVLVLEEIIKLLEKLSPQERLWILEIHVPQYICLTCGDNITDCQHDEEF